MYLRTFSVLAFAASLVAPASAATADDDTQTIVVTGSRDDYRAGSTRTGTRTDTEVRDIPQSISVVTEAQIDDQALLTIGDVLRYVPGAMIGQGEGHRDQVTLRGNNSTADFFVDGIRDDVQYYRGLYNVDRVEVLKGPNAMIFGRGGGGGVVNRVTKTPWSQSFAGGSASVDSFGAGYVDLDVNQPLGEEIGARLNAVYEEFGNHRDVYGGRRIAANPTLGFAVGRDTEFGLAYEYVGDERVVDRGIPSFAGRPLEGFRDTFFGARGVNQADFDAHILKGHVEHRFSDALTLNSRLLYGDYDKAYQNAFAATAVTASAAGARQLGVEAYRDETQRDNLFSQTDLILKARTGGIGHTFLAGLEFGDQGTSNRRINGFFDSGVPTTNSGRRTTVNLSDPVAIPPITFRAGAGNRSVETDADVLAFYFQDQVEIGGSFEIIGGIRYDRFRLRVDDLISGAGFRRTDDLWSPRAGLVFHPIEPVSLYASYSRSFLPQSGDQFLSLDLTIETLKPERFDNYEVGLKWELRDGLLFTAAAYRLDRSNTRAPGATPGSVVLTGEQRSKGIELGLAGHVADNWVVNAGYALQDAEIRATTAAAPAGRKVPQVPRHQASLWTRYDFAPRLGAGLGFYHQSKSFASISNAVTLPGYMRVDAALFFRLTRSIQAQLNVENLLGDDYFPTAHNDNNITTGAPRSARATLRFHF